MKENYSIMCEDILNNLNGKKKLLLHSCCGPCSSYVISYLTNYFDITILYYNPNIYPYDEYLKRKEEQIKLIKEIDKSNNVDILDCDYDNENYEELIKGLEKEPERGKRCYVCYRMRMEKTASTAKDNGYDYFCTTLSVSPYKNALWINEIGKELEDKYKVKWLYSDFKKKDGYKKIHLVITKNIIYIDKITVDVYILNHSNFFLFHIFYYKVCCYYYCYC